MAARKQNRQRGTTLLETLIATAICTTVVFSLAGLIAMSTQQGKNSGQSVSQATALAAQRLDRLMALTWTDVTTDSGLTAGGSLTTNTTGFVEYLDATGTLLTGVTPPDARIFFTRRWLIADTTATTKTITVWVGARAVGSVSADAGSGPSARLVCVKAQL